MSLAPAIKKQALELGFDLVGIVRPERLNDEAVRLRAWLDRGFAGTMDWMDRSFEKRTDPFLHMPDVRSIVCVALNYRTSHEIENRPGYGRISRYAWGDDYHQVVGDRLRLLLDWICMREAECRGKICVDTSPVMDKVWAVRGGIGWIGKHSNLIHPDLGSWLFLGELLLNVELDCEEILMPDHCGTCTLCLDACPTEAIVEPYVVDSRKCISYQTIEYRGNTLQVDTHGWIYGCDVCQEVCPWNQSVRKSEEPAFQPRPELVSLSLEEFSRITEEEFRAVSKNSAIRRTKHRGMVRNAQALLSSEGYDEDSR